MRLCSLGFCGLGRVYPHIHSPVYSRVNLKLAKSNFRQMNKRELPVEGEKPYASHERYAAMLLGGYNDVIYHLHSSVSRHRRASFGLHLTQIALAKSP